MKIFKNQGITALVALVMLASFIVPSVYSRVNANKTSTDPSFLDEQIEKIEEKVVLDLKNGEDNINLVEEIKENLSKSEEKILEEKGKQLIDEIEKAHEDVIADERYVNDMSEKANEKLNYITKEIEKAKIHGEKLYSQEEILKLSPEEAKIEESELALIKSTILGEMIDVALTEVAFEKIDDENEIKNSFDSSNKIDIPLSLLKSEPVDEKDGSISDNGFPGCNDNNGYGYKNVIGSDCWVPLMYYVNLCVRDELNKHNKKIKRYCVYNKNNCSWVVGHSKYKHTHSAWTKAWLT